MSYCECGGVIDRDNPYGHFFSFGEYGKVKMMVNLQVRFCYSCKEVYTLVGDESEEFDDALEYSIAMNVIELFESIKDKHQIKTKEIYNFLGIEKKALLYRKPTALEFKVIKMIAIKGPSLMDDMNKETW